LNLEKLILTNFKNYTSERVNFSPTLNAIVGKNGMGKTNLLDAIYYLCMSKSNFSGNDRNVVQKTHDFFRLEGQFKRKEKKEKIVVKVIPGKQKIIERNGTAYSKLADHIGLFPVVIIAPDDTSLVTEGSEARRRFLDNTLSQSDPNYLTQLMRYNKVIRQRNAALKNMAIQHRFNATLIKTYDQQLLEPAALIFEKRKSFLEKIDPIFNEFYQKIAAHQETVQFNYKSKLIENSLEELLEENLEKDRILQRTTAGIHKDDLAFHLDNSPLKQFASQGQIKSFVLALKLAQFDFLKKIKNTSPILLLDDIFDKLDSSRVKQLLDLLLKNDFGQIFITDTHETRVEEIVKDLKIGYKKMEIKDGQCID
jgi:DNA replication and repair protein RecF